MDIDAFINCNDQSLVYQCTYYYDLKRWQEASLKTKKALNRLSWSGYIKYLGDDDKACEKIKLAKDKRFSCYNREEDSISLSNHSEIHYVYT